MGFYNLVIMLYSLAFINEKLERGFVSGMSLYYKTAKPALQDSTSERGVYA